MRIGNVFQLYINKGNSKIIEIADQTKCSLFIYFGAYKR